MQRRAGSSSCIIRPGNARDAVVTSSSGARLHYAPVVNTGKQVISERYLSEDNRIGIADLRTAGFGLRAIAAKPVDGQQGAAPQPGPWPRTVPAVRRQLLSALRLRWRCGLAVWSEELARLGRGHLLGRGDDPRSDPLSPSH